MARQRRKALRDVLGKHQFAESDSGGCSARDGFGLYASPPVPDDEQMADHQIEQAIADEVIIKDFEHMERVLNSLGGTDPQHWQVARMLADHGYAIVRLSEPR